MMRRSPRVRLTIGFHALPDLGSPKQGNPEIATHEHFLAVIDQAELAAIDPAGIRIDNVPAHVLIALLPHIAYQHQADNRLIPAFIWAAGAFSRVIVGRGARLDATEKKAMVLIDIDEPQRLAGLSAKSPPPTRSPL